MQAGEPLRFEAAIPGAAVALGPDGSLHVALDADADGQAFSTVRYLRLGAAD